MVYQPSIDLIEQNTLIEKFLTVITLCLFDREFIVAEIGAHICVRDLDVLLLGDSLEDKQARDAVPGLPRMRGSPWRRQDAQRYHSDC